jgi:DNA-binding LytR/AlgR family response regulator
MIFRERLSGNIAEGFNEESDLTPIIVSALKTNRTRVIVKRGQDFCIMKAEDMACFFTEARIVYGMDGEGKKYILVSNNLFELAEELNQDIFHRVNRKYIINANFLKKFRAVERTKILVELSIKTPEDIIIGQTSTKSFKNWIQSL